MFWLLSRSFHVHETCYKGHHVIHVQSFGLSGLVFIWKPKAHYRQRIEAGATRLPLHQLLLLFIQLLIVLKILQCWLKLLLECQGQILKCLSQWIQHFTSVHFGIWKQHLARSSIIAGLRGSLTCSDSASIPWSSDPSPVKCCFLTAISKTIAEATKTKPLKLVKTISQRFSWLTKSYQEQESQETPHDDFLLSFLVR